MHSIYLVDYRKSGEFFKRLITADPSRSHHIISTVRSVCTSTESTAELTYIHSLSAKSSRTTYDFSRTREVALGCLSTRRCLHLFQSIERALTDSVKSHAASASQTTIFVWNGATVMGEAARQFQRDSGCNVVFMELSNLPGRLFADPAGTNAQALLFSEPALLSRFGDNNAAFPEWRNAFIERKRAAHAPPQAITARQLDARHFLDGANAVLFGYRHFNWTAMFDKAASQLRKHHRNTSTASTSSKPAGGYAFFPMQVSSDTQLLLNSKLDNIQALAEIASRCTLPILIKPHPAEIDTRYIHRAIENRNLGGRVDVTNCNTTALIEGADVVYTINSTVGLEAKILGITTHFLADSIYAQIDQDTLPNYIMGYLLDVDFFETSSTPIPAHIVEELHARARLRIIA